MATERNKPSVIAKLMGLEEVSMKQQPVSRPKRVLSENYLQKSASVGSIKRRSSKIRQKSRETLKNRNPTLDDSSKYVPLRHIEKRNHSFDSHTTFGWEFKKQLLERSKRAKVCREIWSSNHGQVPSMADLESKKRLELGTRVVISSNEDWKDKSVTKLPVIKRFNISSHHNTKLKKMSERDLRSNSGGNNNNLSSNSVDVEFSCGDEGIKQISEEVACEDRLASINCVDIDDELPMNICDAHQPSPNSVLEPDNSSISECDDNFTTDLHGLWMKLQILKSESEENESKPEIVTSSDGDATERCFGPNESQEFLYLVNVLNEIGSFETWHSVEHMVSPLIFETLEKKYGKQESWNKADRRLLFDRIKLGLSEILRTRVGFLVCSKLLRRKMSNFLRRDVIEEELWNMLVSEGKEVNADLSEKAVGNEPWLELGDEVESIVGEIEAFLFNELALELVDF